MHVRRVVTTREGGQSKSPYATFNLGHHVGDEPQAVSANRRRLAEAIGLAEDRVVWMDQVHGTKVALVDEPVAAPIPGTDAVVTTQVGLALAVLVADCVPVLLADLEAGVVAAAHAGRVGASSGVIPATLDTMRQAGALVARIEVLLGPAVCGNCYEVPEQMRAEVDAQLPGSGCTTRAGTAGLDLRAGLRRQLADAGVAGVAIDPRCTVEDDTLFSHRREGKTGRLAGVVWIEP